MSSIKFKVWHADDNPVCDVGFIDEDHVVLGHADGSVRILTFGSNQVITASVDEPYHTPIQQLVSKLWF